MDNGTLVLLVPILALLIPITYGMDPTSALIMLAGIYYGAMYGGSTTSILLNTPGETGSMVTAMEGNKMAKSGRAGAAQRHHPARAARHRAVRAHLGDHRGQDLEAETAAEPDHPLVLGENVTGDACQPLLAAKGDDRQDHEQQQVVAEESEHGQGDGVDVHVERLDALTERLVIESQRALQKGAAREGDPGAQPDDRQREQLPAARPRHRVQQRRQAVAPEQPGTD